MSRIKSLVFLLTLAAQVPLASATVTYAVGSCKPSLRSFTGINLALGATPAPDVVEVCPGTYAEEVGIYKPVTLEGISSGGSDQVIITPPSGGLFIDSGDDVGDPVAAQVLVESSTGEVNLINLTIDGTGNNVTTQGEFVAGVFYQNSAGTIKHVTVQNQNGNGEGVGIWAEGGSANPKVVVEDNNAQAADFAGIYVEANSSSSAITATISKNNIANGGANSNGIYLLEGLTASVTGNVISGGFEGIFIDGGVGSASQNKIVSAQVGIEDDAGLSLTSNTIYNTLFGAFGGIGIIANTSAPITGNTIAQAPTAIDFKCNAGNNVHSNTILNTTWGLVNVLDGVDSPNSYYNVFVISSGGC
jgi:nitrous oxidase accessory protein NosD